jgi:hypothetical protein
VTDDLIERLAADLKPTPKRAVAARLALGAGVGAALSAVLVLATIGLRPDLAAAMEQAMFWAKLAYPLSLGALALWTCERLARPAGSAKGRFGWVALPVLALAALAAWQLAQAPPQGRMPMLMGHTARVCPWLILTFSIPPLAGLVWAVRGLAPTRLRLAGAAVGLAAGGAGAAAYAFHCDEMAAPFLAVWYTLGIAAVGALSWLVGPRLLKW